MLDLNKLKIADDFDDGLKGQKVFDIVRFDKPQPNEWFKLFDLGEGFKSFANVVITKQPDARGEVQSYLYGLLIIILNILIIGTTVQRRLQTQLYSNGRKCNLTKCKSVMCI